MATLGATMSNALLPGSDPAIQSYTPGSFTVPTGSYVVLSRHLTLTGVQRVVAQGTATIRIS